MKNIFIVFSFCFMGLLNAQEKKLEPFFKGEVFIYGLTFGYEFPLNDKLLLDLKAGLTGRNSFGSTYSLTLFDENGESFIGPFFTGALRYYFNRDRREKKGRSLENNAGTFWVLRTKLNTNGLKDYGSVWMNEIHLGQQLPFTRSNFYFRYHLGLGYGYNLKQNSDFSGLYPALGVVFGYRLFNEEKY